ncbi:MAG: alpha/beta fold hydrolase [Burkholderiaceae bacterium]
MLARLQQGLVFGLFLLAALWIWWSRALPFAVVVAGALVLLSGHAAVLAIEFALAHWLNRTDPAPRASTSMVIRAWVSESITATRVFLWRQPFRSNAWPDQARSLSTGPTGKRGVVLIHGFICNRGLWNPWMQRLRRAGHSFVAVNLEPVFGSIDDYTSIIEEAVCQAQRATGLPPLLVCHSMGGLAARAWLRKYQADHRIAQVVTIGTPHHGTWWARFSHMRNGHQMRPGKGWLAQLREEEPQERNRLFTCYYSNCDNIVLPASAATLPGAENRFVPGAAHVAMAFDARVMDPVLAMLESPATEF